ncbi:MAG: hypothetical protein GTN37_04395 [Candidatus Aenigmarchaeota archaeon]|nr:hypothetical protein [Candidatus Aenigmarchaeota archaeon]NIS73635.1 hypothetical protein [Candidatus Aenigmarchaeota archaeon]
MLETYTPEQQRAVEEKIKLFEKLKEKDLPDGEWSDRIHAIKNEIWRKRTGYVKENFVELNEKLKKYKTPVERAFRLVFFEYMKIDPKDVEFEFFPNKRRAKAIFIRSHNFCPYQHAFKELGFNSVWYCEFALGKSIESMANEFLLHPEQNKKSSVVFGRNYKDYRTRELGQTEAGIRPYEDECQEYFIERSLQLHDPIRYKAIERVFKTNLKIPYKEAKRIVSYYP